MRLSIHKGQSHTHVPVNYDNKADSGSFPRVQMPVSALPPKKLNIRPTQQTVQSAPFNSQEHFH